MLEIRIEGATELIVKLTALARRLDNMRSVYTDIGWMLHRNLVKTMSAGKSPEGRPLAPVRIWTRIAGRTAGASRSHGGAVPLINTGQLRAAMGMVALKSAGLEFGFLGKQYEKAEHMIKGVASRMKVREKGVKGKYSGIKMAQSDGHKYLKVNTSSGWITKRVGAGNTISIKPAARDFFHLTQKHAQDAERICDRYLAGILEAI